MTKWAEGQNRILESRRIGVRDGYEGRPQQPPQQVVLGSLGMWFKLHQLSNTMQDSYDRFYIRHRWSTPLPLCATDFGDLQIVNAVYYRISIYGSILE